jgi:hypothetical protein
MIQRNYKPPISMVVVIVALLIAPGCRSKEPQLSVFSPAQSSHFAPGDTIHFASELNSGADPGVTTPDAWRWVSDIDGEIGRGPRVNTPNLRIGEHHVTVNVRHKLGLSGAQITVFVDSIRPR